MGEDEVFLPAREEYHHESPVDDGSTTGSAAQRQQSRHRRSVGARILHLRDCGVPRRRRRSEYEDLGPNVELARVVRTDSADATRADTRDVDSRLSRDARALGARGLVRVQALAPAQVLQDVRGYRLRQRGLRHSAHGVHALPALGDAFAASPLESVKARLRSPSETRTPPTSTTTPTRTTSPHLAWCSTSSATAGISSRVTSRTRRRASSLTPARCPWATSPQALRRKLGFAPTERQGLHPKRRRARRRWRARRTRARHGRRVFRGCAGR